MLEDVNAVMDAVSAIRVTGVLPENDIHRLVERAFIENGLDCAHEFKLGRGRRVDFMVNRTAVEIKQGTPAASAVRKQIAGYLESDEVDDLVVITRRNLRLPTSIGGKQVFVLSLDRLWGISLP